MFESEKKHEKPGFGNDLAPVATTNMGEVQDYPIKKETDAVFGEINEDGPNYKDVRPPPFPRVPLPN
jgi:hypothetical protein